MNNEEHIDKSPDKSAASPAGEVQAEPTVDTGSITLEDEATDRAVDAVNHSESDAALEAAFTPQTIAIKYSLWQKFLDHKKWTIPLSLAIITVLVVFGLPISRYKVLGLLIKKQYTITLLDSSTHKPVSGAEVTIGTTSVSSDGNGKAVFKVLPVGPKTVQVSKQYYKSSTTKIFVGLSGTHSNSINLVATGRQVHIIVVNKATGKGIAGASIAAADTTAKTDSSGNAQLVLPADKNTTPAIVTANGYLTNTADIQITTQEVTTNKLQLVPAGKVYFLSNRSGTIDVVSTNYDGSNRQTVLAGTGYEAGYATQIFLSPDQKYIMLLARRANNTNGSGLYLISTADNKMTKVEELSNAAISAVGWSNDSFVYSIQDFSKNAWDSAQSLLKSYSATGSSSQVLDQTTAEGTSFNDYAGQTFSQPITVMDGSVIYAKSWNSSYSNTSRLSGKKNSIFTVQVNGSNKKDLRDLDIPGGSSFVAIGNTLAGPHTVYFEMPTNASADPAQGALYFKYTKGSLTQLSNFTYGDYSNPNLLGGFYSLSPSGNATLYSDSVDGHLVISVGDANGGNKQKVLTLPTDGQVKGWLGDSYVLVTQQTNQLYVVPASPSAAAQAIQVSDFYVVPQGHD